MIVLMFMLPFKKNGNFMELKYMFYKTEHIIAELKKSKRNLVH